MSYIVLPDDNPGRCRNLRLHHHGNGETEYLRCLDYEDVVHVCSFPPPMSIPSRSWGECTSVYSPTKPAPWVKPQTAAGGTE